MLTKSNVLSANIYYPALVKISYKVSLFHVHNDFKKPKTLLIHHGMMGSSRNFRSLAKNPKISNHANSYLIDCRNHGQSPHTATHTIANLADDLFKFISEKLKNEQEKKNKWILMGHSMGGMAILEFAKKYPFMQHYIKQLIVVDILCKPLHKHANKSSNWSATG